MNLNEAYEEYVRSNDIEPLYPFVKQRATQAVVSVIHRAAPEDLVITLTTNVLMDIAKFKPGRSAFASWVFLKAKHDCIDELKRGDTPYIDPILDEDGLPHFQRWAFDSALDPPKENEFPEVDDSLLELYSRLETVLDPDEQELIRLKFEGREEREIAEVLEMPLRTLQLRYNQIKEKLKNIA